MDSTTLTITFGASLFMALLVGWGLRWVFEMLNPKAAPAPVPDSEWADYAKSCETERDTALSRLNEVEREYDSKLTQTQAELQATMDGLRAARQTANELQSELDALKSGA